MRSKALKRVLAALVVLVFAFPMMVSLSGFQTYASSVRKTPGLDYGSRFDLLQVPADRVVRAIVLLDDKSLTEQNYNVRTTSMSHSAVNAQQKLLAKQNSIAAKMTSSFDVSVLYNYTVLLNGMAIETTYGNLQDIEAMDGVSRVYLANTYSVPDVEEVPMTECANDMVNLGNLHNSGYDGDGIVVAVLDTGLNINHEAFKDYGIIDNVVLTQNSVENADTLKKGVYVSDKIPFVYDYADDDTDVSDTDGHGTHVTGIAAGYVQEDDGAVTFSGSAPAAQVLNMKIFSSEEGAHGTDSSIYFAALEDAYVLGADVINMSIGAEAGFAYDTELEDEVFGNIYKKLEDAGIVTCISAGNEYSKAYNNLNWLSQYAGVESVISSYTDYGNVATPSVYEGNLSVASAENLVFPAEAIRVGETVLQATDSCTDGVHDFIDTFGGQTLEFVMVPNFGAASDYEGINVEGKIAVISRGDITFEEKVENAANAKAIGAVVYNNDVGAISMAIETFEIPAISVEMTAKEAFEAATDGTFFVYDGMVKVDNSNGGLMSDFSSWGPTPELTFKPEITGIGGNVYSADATTNDGYIVYSGTSMASPNVAGTMACLLQAIYATTSVESKYEASQLIESLALSTAYVLADEESFEYSPRKQGAGLIDASSALAAEAYIVNPVMSLGDDPNRTGSYDVEFTLKRRTSGTLKYSIEDSVLFDYVEVYTEDEDGIDGKYNYICSDYFRGHDESWITITSNFANNEVILADGVDEVDVKVNVKLSSDAMAYLDEMFENGTYVEGFIYLENADLTELHASFMAYYGNWCDSPILDRYDFRDLIDATADLYTVDIDGEGNTLADYGYTVYDLLEASLGYNEAYLYNMYAGQYLGYLGDNLFFYFYHNDGRNAISTALTDAEYYMADTVVAYPSMLRNARHIIMTVTDVDTGEVYYVDDTEYARKDIYDEDYGMYFQTTTFFWDGTDADGNYVPNGTKVMITFDAQLAYEGAELQKDIWSFPLTVDYQAPEIKYGWDAETRQLTVKMSDNGYIQAFEAYSKDVYKMMTEMSEEEYENFNPYDYYLIDEGFDELVSETTKVYDFSKYKGNDLYIDVYDYATNGTVVAINDLSKSQGTITFNVDVPVSDQFTVVSSTPSTGIEYGGSFTFTVNNSNGAQTEEFEVYANDKLLTPVDGVYTVSDITSDVTLTLKDVTAPEATLTINGDKTSSDVVTDVDFSFVTNEDVTYSITAEDLGSGIAGLYYMVSDKQLSQEELASSDEWQNYSAQGAIIKDGQYIVYVKAVDAAGNTTYV
ncbi:MAG: S8 family serine peptidase, partial [Acutalibacteraceae bacterium]